MLRLAITAVLGMAAGMAVDPWGVGSSTVLFGTVGAFVLPYSAFAAQDALDRVYRRLLSREVE